MVQEIYKRNPELYDRIHDGKNYEAEVQFVLDRFENRGSGTRVLDVGCGTGEHAKHLHERGYDVVGVDANENVLDIARRKVDAEFYQAELPDLEAVDFEETFDLVVVLYDVINYLDHDALEPTFATLDSLLRDDGVLIVDNATIFDDDRPPQLSTTTVEDGKYVRLGKLEHARGPNYRWEAVVIAQRGEDFDFYTDEFEYTRFENEHVRSLLEDLGYEVEIYDGYDSGSRTDAILTVFVAS